MDESVTITLYICVLFVNNPIRGNFHTLHCHVLCYTYIYDIYLGVPTWSTLVGNTMMSPSLSHFPHIATLHAPYVLTLVFMSGSPVKILHMKAESRWGSVISYGRQLWADMQALVKGDDKFYYYMFKNVDT